MSGIATQFPMLSDIHRTTDDRPTDRIISSNNIKRDCRIPCHIGGILIKIPLAILRPVMQISVSSRGSFVVPRDKVAFWGSDRIRTDIVSSR